MGSVVKLVKELIRGSMVENWLNQYYMKNFMHFILIRIISSLEMFFKIQRYVLYLVYLMFMESIFVQVQQYEGCDVFSFFLILAGVRASHENVLIS